MTSFPLDLATVSDADLAALVRACDGARERCELFGPLAVVLHLETAIRGAGHRGTAYSVELGPPPDTSRAETVAALRQALVYALAWRDDATLAPSIRAVWSDVLCAFVAMRDVEAAGDAALEALWTRPTASPATERL